jgi:pimeloyl-ACP methyl ester carboxylesterase
MRPDCVRPDAAGRAVPAPELRRLDDDPAQRYWVSAPRCGYSGRGGCAGLLVSVHGISRNAGAHARALAQLAEDLDLVLVAPHFSHSRFPDYQRMGRPERLGPGGRADHMLLRIARVVRAEHGLPEQPFLLIGHSGGAQFALRFALTQPASVAAYVLSAPGSYCWPDLSRRFPHGMAPSRAFPDLRPDLAALLQRPGLVLVGERDVERDEALRQGERIDAQQGRSRIERARHWVAAMQQHAAEARTIAPITLHTVAGCGHGFSALANSEDWRRSLRQHFASTLAGLR